MWLNGYRSERSALRPGFSLLETLLAMALGCVLMLAIAQVFPLLRQRTQILSAHYQLDQLLRENVLLLSKELQRAGGCFGRCQGRGLVFGHRSGEAANSCMIVAYDLNFNGVWEASGAAAEYFAYRLRQGILETRRGRGDCQGHDWQALIDPSEVQVAQLQFSSRPVAAQRLIDIRLVAKASRLPSVKREILMRVATHNAL
jgi:prepilin peptidase dependent protein B